MPNSVQESDASFFESFTALSWKRENRRMSAVRAAESRAEKVPIAEKEVVLKEDEIETVNEREQLYVDVLYTIANSVGCQQQGGQVCFILTSSFYLNLNDFSPHSLLTLRMKCISPHSVRLVSHPIDIIDCLTRRLKKSRKLSFYQ